MEFFLLGSLLVCPAGKGEVRVPPGKQRVLLAVLLLHSNHVVSADVLVEALWGSEPPPSVAASPSAETAWETARREYRSTGEWPGDRDTS